MEFKYRRRVVVGLQADVVDNNEKRVDALECATWDISPFPWDFLLISLWREWRNL